MIKILSAVLPVSVLFLAGVTALAHHGRGPYSQESITIENATVQQFLYVNPHTQLQFTAPDGSGGEIQWMAEGPSPNELVRAGVRPDLLSAGDVITVTAFPHDDRPHHLLLQALTLPNGERVVLR